MNLRIFMLAERSHIKKGILGRFPGDTAMTDGEGGKTCSLKE